MISPAVQKAIDYITTRLEKCEWTAGDKLPTVNDLAGMVGVSRGTMWKAIVFLKRQGMIWARKGGHLYAGHGDEQSTPGPHILRTHSWEAKRIQFEQDLLKGMFPANRPLPAIGELQTRYGASYRTMRKLLNSLIADGLLMASNKKFHLPRSLSRPFNESVCLLWEGKDYALRPRSVREQRFIEALQNECAHSDRKLTFLGFDLYAPSWTATIRDQLRRHESVAGFIVRLISLWDISAQDRYIGLLMELSLTQKPIAILDELGTFALPAPLATNRLIKIFRIGGFLAGKLIGRTLLALGHRQAAFITHFHGMAWSVKRYQGVVSEFAKAGYRDSVSLFSMEDPIAYIEILLNPGNLKSKSILMFFSEIAGLREENDALKSRFAFLDPIVRAHADTIRQFRNNIKTLERLPQKNMQKEGYESLIDRSITFMRRGLYQQFASHLFNQAMANPACTAWVCANDDIAVFALNFLRSRKVKVPDQMSVTGFDGDPLGLEYGITSFDFDLPNISRQMLSFISHPAGVTRFTKNNTVEMPGFVIHRDSSGKAQQL
jgi:DNA-binding transcriptional regulator YhcF (GntR family)